METLKDADRIRQYARDTYIQPAIRRGERHVQIRAGDVHNALKLRRQHPNVCQALRSRIFLKDNCLTLEAQTGPSSGQSSSVVLTYRLGNGQLAQPKAGQSSAQGRYKNPALLELLKLEGMGKEVFASLGGGENFLRAERQAFADGLDEQDRERGLR